MYPPLGCHFQELSRLFGRMYLPPGRLFQELSCLRNAKFFEVILVEIPTRGLTGSIGPRLPFLASLICALNTGTAVLVLKLDEIEKLVPLLLDFLVARERLCLLTDRIAHNRLALIDPIA